MEDVWTERFVVRDYEVDAQGRLSVLTLCHLMQEAASRHAQTRGMAVDQLRAENFTWLLSRMLLRITDYPGWQEPIEIQTWPTGIEKRFALRDFRATDQEGRVFGASISAWLVIDTVKWRLARIEPFLDRFVLRPDDRALPGRLAKLPRLAEAEHERTFSVRYRDLDLNQHVNNVSYLEWILESLPFDLKENASLAELEVNYLSEAFPGDRVLARWQPQGENGLSFQHSIVQESGGQELIRARTVWKAAEGRGPGQALDNRHESGR
jgi:medium-chain acyl-[acyl-carrier-protein] hydrolase